jgi:hypothetical protein
MRNQVVRSHGSNRREVQSGELRPRSNYLGSRVGGPTSTISEWRIQPWAACGPRESVKGLGHPGGTASAGDTPRRPHWRRSLLNDSGRRTTPTGLVPVRSRTRGIGDEPWTVPLTRRSGTQRSTGPVSLRLKAGSWDMSSRCCR